MYLCIWLFCHQIFRVCLFFFCFRFEKFGINWKRGFVKCISVSWKMPLPHIIYLDRCVQYGITVCILNTCREFIYEWYAVTGIFSVFSVSFAAYRMNFRSKCFMYDQFWCKKYSKNRQTYVYEIRSIFIDKRRHIQL